MSRNELIDVSGILLVETERAIKFSETGEHSHSCWLPKSQIEIHRDDPKKSTVIEVTLPEWLAKDKGLI